MGKKYEVPQHIIDADFEDWDNREHGCAAAILIYCIGSVVGILTASVMCKLGILT